MHDSFLLPMATVFILLYCSKVVIGTSVVARSSPLQGGYPGTYQIGINPTFLETCLLASSRLRFPVHLFPWRGTPKTEMANTAKNQQLIRRCRGCIISRICLEFGCSDSLLLGQPFTDPDYLETLSACFGVHLISSTWILSQIYLSPFRL
ncbi:hypothetical protein BDZ97DRAFT_328214 [Flammula alnicola]|nr:hypothetical protein BDZ97DRAFT_328214 [Flammula alnicola]